MTPESQRPGDMDHVPGQQPDHEQRRLETLRRLRILDTLPERSFDDITALAAFICETPIALISLIDEHRQWFKARIGMSVEQLPREESICAHAILTPQVLTVIPDITRDARFQRNDLTSTQPAMRFYAGAPLVMRDGTALGTLCVIDTVPRELSDRQRNALSALSRSVVNEFELRRLALETADRRMVLYDMLHQLTRELDPDLIMRKAVQRLVALNFWESVGISVPSADGRHWQTRAEDRMAAGEVGRLHAIDQGVIGRAYRTATTQLVSNAGTDGDFFLGEEVGAVASELAVPIIFDSQILGVLNLESSQANAFSDEDVALAKSICEVLAIALKNAQRFAAIQQESVRRSQSESRQATIFQRSPLGIVITRLHDDVLIEINPAWFEMFGYSREQALGRTVLELGLWADPDDRRKMLATMAAQGRVSGFETTFRHRSGEFRQVLLSAEQITIDDEACMLVHATDISTRKAVEDALRASEEQYRGLMESLDSAIMAFDPHGRCLYANDVAARQFADQVDNVIGKSTYDLFPQEVAADQVRIIQEVFAADRNRVIEAPIDVRGRVRWYRVSIQPIHNQHGHVMYVLVNATDIHDLKTAQQELQILNRTLEERVAARSAEVQDLYENAPSGYHSLDTHGIIVRINRTELDWLGYERHEVIGRPFTDFISADGQARFARNYPLFKQRGWVHDLEFDYVRKDGSTLPVVINATAIYDEAGTFLMGRSIVVDNTERKLAEASLRAANAEMERALRTKDEFLATMSHELRTPLNAILGLSESLREGVRGPLTARQDESIGHIAASGQHLLELINDILDLSRIEAGRLDLQKEPVIVGDLCRASLQFIKEQALKKQLRLTFSLNDELAEIEVDPKRLKQMLTNLLSNAVKFTPQGGTVSLEAAVLPEVGLVRFSIWDTGIGIATEDLNKLFKPFTQLDSRLSRQHEGSGLGLALVHRLAEMHNGTVTVESSPGSGSCFTLSLPHHPKQPSAPAGAPTMPIVPPAPPNAIRPCIVLAEDNQVNLEVMRDYLEAQGYRIAAARNGHEALALAEQRAPALILMDIQMPEMDGITAIRQLRRKPAFADTPIIALTALAMPGDRERCLEAGANEYLAKPLSLKELTGVIRRLLAD